MQPNESKRRLIWKPHVRMRALQNVCNIPVPEVEMPWKMPPASTSRNTSLLGWRHVLQCRGWWFKDLRRNSLMGSSCLYIYIYIYICRFFGCVMSFMESMKYAGVSTHSLLMLSHIMNSHFS
jgi:hypothetical protein